jgi:hypothetical protein
MKSYVFNVVFGVGPKVSKSAQFSLELNDNEIAYIKDYLQRNGFFCGYFDIEFDSQSVFKNFDHRALFDRINDAANDAVVAAINCGRKKKIDYFDIPWESMTFDFIWPEDLINEI